MKAELVTKTLGHLAASSTVRLGFLICHRAAVRVTGPAACLSLRPDLLLLPALALHMTQDPGYTRLAHGLCPPSEDLSPRTPVPSRLWPGTGDGNRQVEGVGTSRMDE